MSDQDDRRTCSECGTVGEPGAVICAECGSFMRRAAPAAPTPPPEASTPPRTAGAGTGPVEPPAPSAPAGFPASVGSTPGPAVPSGFAGSAAGPGPFGGPLPPVPPSATGRPTGPAGPPPKKPASQGKRLAVIAGVGAVLVIGLFAAITLTSEDDGEETSSGTTAVTTTVAKQTTPTGPRGPSSYELDDFCASPVALAEVAAHDPAKPSRIYLSTDGSGLNENGVTSGNGNGTTGAPDGPGSNDMGPNEAMTVVSPQPDGVVIGDIEQVDGVRTIACVDFKELRTTGKPCSYLGADIGNVGQGTSHELASSVWTVDVYELHSAKKLTGGELASRADTCPESIKVATDTEPVHFALSNQEIVDWLGTKFPNGVPQ